MKVRVNPELCIACGACINLAPDVYDWGEDDKAVALEAEVPPELEDEAQEALESCPTEAIESY